VERYPKVSKEAGERCMELLQDRLNFEGCLENLVCPTCAMDLSNTFTDGPQAGAKYECTKCDFKWPK
jgi:hypothetical protein